MCKMACIPHKVPLWDDCQYCGPVFRLLMSYLILSTYGIRFLPKYSALEARFWKAYFSEKSSGELLKMQITN